MKKIYYLNPLDSSMLSYKCITQRDTLVLKHRNTISYTPHQFAHAFNNGAVSSKGLMVIVGCACKEAQAQNQRRKHLSTDVMV